MTKDRIKAHLLEIRLYRDSLVATVQAYGKILRYNLKYAAHSIKPMLIMLIPLLVLLTHLNLWFAYQPLPVGQPAILKVFLEKSISPLTEMVAVETPAGLALETPPLRLEEEREIDWRIRTRERGIHEVKARPAGGAAITTAVASGNLSLTPVCPRRSRRLIDNLLYPGNPPLPSSTSVMAVEVTYPARRFSFLGLRLHWLVPYFVLSILFGFILKRPLGVEI